MTEGVAVALITSAANIIVILVTRLWSRSDHRRTSEKLDAIYKSTNGRTPGMEINED